MKGGLNGGESASFTVLYAGVTPPNKPPRYQEADKKRQGGAGGYPFIPSLSISSTTSLTRRMTVTIEAGSEKREEASVAGHM